MSSASTETNTKILLTESNGANGTATPSPPGWSVPEFKHDLGDNPLWQEVVDELAANRQADIAEANRLADLALEK